MYVTETLIIHRIYYEMIIPLNLIERKKKSFNFESGCCEVKKEISGSIIRKKLSGKILFSVDVFFFFQHFKN